MYVRRCNICAACAKRRQRSEEGGRPRRVSPSCLLPRLRRSEASPPNPRSPRFSCVVSAPVEVPVNPSPTFWQSKRGCRWKAERREKEREREGEKTPAPLRICWRWRRCRILASVARRSIDVQPPSAHLLTFSTPFPILSFRLGLTALARSPPLRLSFALRLRSS